MGEVRVHRTRQPDTRFAALPNDTIRDSRLSYAARGYLAEQLSHTDAWEPETASQAARRSRRDRGADAESERERQRIRVELERYGYRHRVVRSAGRGTFSTEVHYYDLPMVPCEDALTCKNCKRADVCPGRIEGAESRPRSDLGKHHVSAGRIEQADIEPSITAPSPRRPPPPEDQPQPEDQEGERNAASQARYTSEPIQVDDFDWIEDQCGGLDGYEPSTVDGMLSGGANRVTIRNTIQAQRRRPAVLARLVEGHTVAEIADGFGVSHETIERDLHALGYD